MAKRQIAERQAEISPTSFWVGIAVLVVLGLAVFALFKVVTIALS
jgi:hypothetical protein